MRTRCRPTYKQYENQTDKRTNKVNKNSALQKLARLGLPLPNAQTKNITILTKGIMKTIIVNTHCPVIMTGGGLF